VSYYEFGAVVVSYPKRHLLYDDDIDAATLRLWLGQGEGFLIEVLDYRGQTTLIKWKDLHDATAIEDLAPCNATRYPSDNFFWRPCSMEAKVDALDEVLCAVSGDLTLTLNVLLEYYKMESSMYRHRASILIANLTKDTTLQANTYVDEL
jgi:hypothetical protein